MAIDKGIDIGCADVQASGGIKHILLRSWATGDDIDYNNSDHSITSLVQGYLYIATKISFKNEQVKWAGKRSGN